jgi:cytochrome c553
MTNSHFLIHTALAVALLTTVGGTALAASGADIANNGVGATAPACSSCHGGQGQGQPEAGFPRLAGLNAGYIEHALSGFASKSRDSAIMTPIAGALSADDRKAVADYFSGLHPPAATPASPPDEALVAVGAEIALRGDQSRAIPACSQCHGSAGLGAGSKVPGIAGQAETYIANRLAAWKKDAPYNQAHPMAAVADKLEDSQIKAVAAYFARLPAAASAATRSMSGDGTQ